MFRHKFNSSMDASLDTAKCMVGSSLNPTNNSYMFALLSLIDQVIDKV